MPNPMCLVEEVVRYLVEARADKDKVNQRGAPAIHMAALSGHVAVVQLLVDLGTDKDQSDCNGAGPLQLSAEQGQLPVVTYLTEVSCDLQKADLHGTVPLHMAALHGHLDVVRALVAAGAEKDYADHHGAVPLHMAALNGETEPRCFRTKELDDLMIYIYIYIALRCFKGMMELPMVISFNWRVGCWWTAPFIVWRGCTVFHPESHLNCPLANVTMTIPINPHS